MQVPTFWSMIRLMATPSSQDLLGSEVPPFYSNLAFTKRNNDTQDEYIYKLQWQRVKFHLMTDKHCSSMNNIFIL